MLGGAVGGLKRGDVPRVVRNLLQECREREVAVTIRLEVVSGYYAVKWQYVAFNEEVQGWEPLAELPREEDL